LSIRKSANSLREEATKVSDDLERDVLQALEEWDQWWCLGQPCILDRYVQRKLLLHLHTSHIDTGGFTDGTNSNDSHWCCTLRAEKHRGTELGEPDFEPLVALSGDLHVPLAQRGGSTEKDQKAVLVEIAETVENGQFVGSGRSVASVARLQLHDRCRCDIGDTLYLSTINGFVFPGVSADGKLSTVEGARWITQENQLPYNVVKAGAEQIEYLANEHGDTGGRLGDGRIADNILKRIRGSVSNQVVSVVLVEEAVALGCEIYNILFSPINLRSGSF
jgi:hypothetical protein